jgi:hypothetical protein
VANKIWQLIGTAITWLSSGGSAAFTPTSLASGAGRQGAYYDLGTASRGRRFNYRAWLKPGATRVVGEVIEVYLVTGDGTHYDNNDGTGDIAVSAKDKLRNAKLLDYIQIDKNAADEMACSGEVVITARWVAPAFWNATANSLSTTAGDYGFELLPIEDEVQ